MRKLPALGRVSLGSGVVASAEKLLSQKPHRSAASAERLQQVQVPQGIADLVWKEQLHHSGSHLAAPVHAAHPYA